MAERQGFEPWVRKAYSGFRDHFPGNRTTLLSSKWPANNTSNRSNVSSLLVEKPTLQTTPGPPADRPKDGRQHGDLRCSLSPLDRGASLAVSKLLYQPTDQSRLRGDRFVVEHLLGR